MENNVLKELLAVIDKKLDRCDMLDNAEKTQEHINDCIKDSKAVNDEYGNSLLSIGKDDRVAKFTSYEFNNETLNWCLWLTLYNGSWVFRRAIDKPAQDEVRCGITVQGDDEYDEVYKQLKRYRFDIIQLLQWGALFGGSIAVMMFDNIKDKEYSKPMSYRTVAKSKTMRLYVTDRWYGVAPSAETVKNMKSLDFGKPKYYDITFTDGSTMRVHHDYILRYEHRTAPRLVKMGMLQGWGYAEGAHIINELARDDKLKSSIQSLVDKSLIEVIKMAGMRGLFMGADKENEAQIRKRLEMVNWGRNFNSLTFLDKDDDYQEHGFSGLTGLSDLLEKNMWQIAAALEMQGILFGDLKGGFSADTEALERYDEVINGRCESYVRPVYDKLLKVIFVMLKKDYRHIEYEFNSLLAAKQDKDRMEGLKAYSELLSQMLGDGVITSELYAEAMQKFVTKGVIDFGLTTDEINKIAENEKTEIEGFDFDEDEDEDGKTNS